MSVNVAHVVLQMSSEPVIFGCAESIARGLTYPSTECPPIAFKSVSAEGHPQYALTDFGIKVKAQLEKWICLNVN